LILEKKLAKKNSNADDDPYEALVLAHNKEMDQLVDTNTISSKVEEEDFDTCLDSKMTKKKAWCQRRHAQKMS
jgi:hypothetical protein